MTDTFILINSCFSSTRRCKESHFSTVHAWLGLQPKSTRALQAHLKAAFDLWSHLLKYSTYRPYLATLNILNYCNENRIRLQLIKEIVASAMPSAFRQSSPVYYYMRVFLNHWQQTHCLSPFLLLRRRNIPMHNEDLQMLKTFESNCMKWFNCSTQIWCKYLSASVLLCSKYADEVYVTCHYACL